MGILYQGLAMQEIESLEQNSLLQGQFEAEALRLGVTRCYFLSPQIYEPQENQHNLLFDPFQACSDARCLIVLLQAYTPIQLSHVDVVPFSAYYVASNQLYHTAKTLEQKLIEQNQQAQRVELPVKIAFLSAGIGEIGENTLLSVHGLGTRFAVQLLLTDAWTPKEIVQKEYNDLLCTHCQKCREVCPGKAIDDAGFHKTKCVRYYMDGQMMPNWVKETIPSLFGCELCQMVCPRNKQQPILPMPNKWTSMFQFEKLLLLEKSDKKWYANLVGKNMLTRGRLRAQAFSLAWRWAPQLAEQYACELFSDSSIVLTDCEKDAVLFGVE